MQNTLDITILCKVVDNFGDIGTVYRLIRAFFRISETRSDMPKLKIRLVVDNLHTFSLLCPKIDENKKVQTFELQNASKTNNTNSITTAISVFSWQADDECFTEFKNNPPHIILEFFECGRPDWLEKLLFDEKVPNIVQILMIDYLTAENYAETFHCLASLTRSSRVQKVNFMPGFTNKTGGLIFPETDFSIPLPAVVPVEMTNLRHEKSNSNIRILFFSYDANDKSVISAFEKFGQECLPLSLQIFLPCEQAKQSHSIEMQHLPFLPQIEWDAVMAESDILFVRGEDSLSQSCLLGKPFVWEAYKQTENYQIVKVKALLEKLKPFFSEEHFKIVENCWLVYNGDESISDKIETDKETAILQFLRSCKNENFRNSFKNFAKTLKKNGDFAQNLLTFLEKTAIMRQ